MKILHIIILMILHIYSNAQNEAYYVKQTQISDDLENFKPLETNPVFTKIVLKEKGIEFYLPDNHATFIEYYEVDKVNLGEKAYRYEISFDDGMVVALFFTPYPLKTSESTLVMAIVSMPGLVEKNPNTLIHFRLVFHEDAVIK